MMISNNKSLINDIDNNWNNCLAYCCHDIKNKEMVEFLLKNNVDFNQKDKQGDDCLTKTARYPVLYEISKLLIEYGADLQNNKRYGSNKTLLTEAVEGNNIQLVKLLLEKNVEINEPNYFDQTALEIAKENNYLEIIELLEKAGAK
jgi:ankyrin repeat protein